MIDSEEFFDFLTSSYQGGKNGQAITAKAARDAVSRCNRIERILAITLHDFFKSEGDFSKLAEKIKSNGELLGATNSNPYGYNNATHAARLYQEFLVFSRKI